MPRANKITFRSGSAAPQASDFVASEPAWDATAGELYVKSAAGSMVAVGRDVLVYATTAAFPATGVAARLYMSNDTSRIYRWEPTLAAYVEIASVGGVPDLDGGTYA